MHVSLYLVSAGLGTKNHICWLENKYRSYMERLHLLRQAVPPRATASLPRLPAHGL